MKLFGLGVAVPLDEAERALAPAEPDELADLLAPDGETVRATVGLTAYDGLFILHDPQDPARVGADFVTGVNAASKTLASLTVRRPAETALDVGTGSASRPSSQRATASASSRPT